MILTHEDAHEEYANKRQLVMTMCTMFHSLLAAISGPM